MRFAFTSEQDVFRHDLRAFLQREVAAIDADDGHSRAFSKRLAEQGWIGLAWPREYGGQGLGPVEQMIYTEEMILHDAPRGYHFTAERQVGPSVIRHGSERQREEWLPRIVNADVSFALGLSEPGAGSDLAAVSTRAERDGDDYVVNGQKIWTSGAHRADAIWLVVRTDPDAPKHRGISCLMVDMDMPGISVNPLHDMTGGHSFNEVFFEDVRVPVERRVGEENRGWYILAEHLDFERSGIERIVDLERLFQRVLEHASELKASVALSGVMRGKLAQLAIELEVGRLLCYRVAWQQSAGRTPNHEASIAKAFGSEWCQRMARAAMNLLQLSGAASKDADLAAEVARRYLGTVSLTIAAGTSEIQRNIIATRGLGLPRS